MNNLNETMKNLREQKLEEELLFEMSSILTKESGLKTKLNLIQNGANRGMRHWARVKVVLNNGNMFPVKVNEKGEIEPFNNSGQYKKLTQGEKELVKEAIKYIKENVKLIMAYWNGLFEEDDLHNILQGRASLEDFLK